MCSSTWMACGTRCRVLVVQLGADFGVGGTIIPIPPPPPAPQKKIRKAKSRVLCSFHGGLVTPVPGVNSEKVASEGRYDPSER